MSDWKFFISLIFHSLPQAMRMWDNFLRLKWNSDDHVNYTLSTGIHKQRKNKNSLV